MCTIKSGVISFALLSIILFQSCTSTTMIQTIPADASVSVNNEYIGQSPCAYSDKKISFSTNYVTIKKEGYEDFNAEFERNEDINPGAIVGGIFIWPIWLWAFDYKPSRTYQLAPVKK
jgi:hypothetical protein